MAKTMFQLGRKGVSEPFPTGSRQREADRVKSVVNSVPEVGDDVKSPGTGGPFEVSSTKEYEDTVESAREVAVKVNIRVNLGGKILGVIINLSSET